MRNTLVIIAACVVFLQGCWASNTDVEKFQKNLERGFYYLDFDRGEDWLRNSDRIVNSLLDIAVISMGTFLIKESYEMFMNLPHVCENLPEFNLISDKYASKASSAVHFIRERFCSIKSDASCKIKKHIYDSSPGIFTQIIQENMFIKAYHFAVAYRDVFSTVDTEHAADIQTQAKKWLVEIQTNVQGKLSLHARKAGALQAVDPNLAAQELTEATTLIAMFPVGSPMRTALQTHWDQALQNERRVHRAPVSLDLLRSTTDRLLHGGL